jgi:hypothetical protein
MAKSKQLLLSGERPIQTCCETYNRTTSSAMTIPKLVIPPSRCALHVVAVIPTRH